MKKTYNQVSKLQFPVLREFISRASISLDEVSKLDQRPFGSLFHRGWIGHRAGHGFYITKAGRDAYAEYMGDARHRLRPEAPLSHYFDPIAYQLRKPDTVKHQSNLQVVRKAGAA